ncbi:MAG: DUF924 family protein [Pseudomonadales bacterium]|nr:DUF924 domain-containing protein [Pseudomonadales bacterium]
MAEALLHFWFGTFTDGFSDSAHRKRWFSGGADFDEECRLRFGPLSAAIIAGEHEDWLDTPRGRLACILACDQLPRNIHRGTAAAFSGDARALQIAKLGVELSLDRDLEFDERAFFYMPFEHSERLIDQHTSVGLFTRLRDATPSGRRHLSGSYLQFAQQHRDLIERFGRFPHRNGVLGRISTPEELEYLRGGNDFGQTSH